MEKETAMKILKELHDKSLFAERTALETIIPELKESEDERIRKALVRFHKSTIDIDGIKGADILAWIEKQGKPQDKGEISDGYHTFNELYYYRMLYNAAFFNMLPKEWVHKSKRHNDGEACFGGGWFIVMANLPTGQISNHYELKDWDLFQIPEKEVADKWDGHTPQEAADRLHKYLLEKQSEQKTAVTDFNAKDWYVSKVDGKIHDMTYNPTDKVEPKFKIGDYIVNDYCAGKVVALTDDAYLLDTEQGIPFSCEHNVHLWTIQDAKDGDVLYSLDSKQPFIFKHRKPNEQAEAYCGLNIYGKFFVWGTKDCVITTDKYIPSTKEQRELLFKKMKEAGYEWDAEKKELKLLITNGGDFEQKQEWSEEDENYLQSAENACEYQYGKNTSTILWLKSLKDRVQPKQEWSEEDKNFMYDTLSNLTELKDRYGDGYGNVGKCIDWLKSLKARVQGKED